MNDTNSITDWFRLNIMVGNPEKFQLMILGTKYIRIKEAIYIDIRNICIKFI